MKESLRNLNSEIERFYSRKSNLSHPLWRLGEACIYNDNEQNQNAWYRGKIVQIIDKDHCLILLVDYGKTRYANRASLKEIYDKFLLAPCQIERAHLSDIDIKDDEIDEKIHRKLVKTITKISINFFDTTKKLENKKINKKKVSRDCGES